MYARIVRSSCVGIMVRLMMCKCKRDDYALDELHYARCIRCLKHIPADAVEAGWEKIR